jgi:hypothetical protein
VSPVMAVAMVREPDQRAGRRHAALVALERAR